MAGPFRKTVAAVLAVAFLMCFITCGCARKSDQTAVKDESGLVLSGKMPDKLPDGMAWYDFKEDTAIFDYLSETIGEYFLSDITWFSGYTWLFICESGSALPVYHIMSFDNNDNVVNDYVIRNEFGDSISLNRMILGDRLYLTAYDFSTRKDYLYPVDEKTGCVTPDNKIDFIKNDSQEEIYRMYTFAGDDIAILQNAQTPCVELINLTDGTVKHRVNLEALSRDYNIKYPEGIICAGKNKVVVWGIT